MTCCCCCRTADYVQIGESRRQDTEKEGLTSGGGVGDSSHESNRYLDEETRVKIQPCCLILVCAFQCNSLTDVAAQRKVKLTKAFTQLRSNLSAEPAR